MSHHQGTTDAITGIENRIRRGDRTTLNRLNYLEWKCKIITWNDYQKEKARIRRAFG